MGEKFWISCRVPGAKTIQERICRPTGRMPSDDKFVIRDYKQVHNLNRCCRGPRQMQDYELVRPLKSMKIILLIQPLCYQPSRNISHKIINTLMTSIPYGDV